MVLSNTTIGRKQKLGVTENRFVENTRRSNSNTEDIDKLNQCDNFASKFFSGVLGYAAANSSQFSKASTDQGDGGIVFNGNVSACDLFKRLSEAFSQREEPEVVEVPGVL